MPAEILDYKVTALEKRMDSYETKLDLVLSKLDLMRDSQAKSQCPAPGTCITLRVACDNMIKVTDKLTERVEKIQEHVEKFDAERIEAIEDEISAIKLWRNWLVGTAVPIIALGGFFAEELKKWLFK